LITVIGDSYIEALNVNVGESYPFLLREKLKNDFEVYAFGVSGAPLSQYLHISRYVDRHFNPDILIFNIYHNDFDESIRELKPSYAHFLQVSITEQDSVKEIPPQPNHSFVQYRSWERIIYHSALFRYLYFNLKVQSLRERLKARTNRFEANINVDEVSKNKDLIIKSTNYLVKTIRQENMDRRVIFLMDAPRFSIYDNTLDKSNVMWLNNLMDSICTHNNIEFIDLTTYMKEAYSKNHVKFNYDIDGHWNEYGHKFVTDVLYKYLRNKE
jgi:GDSL-like Lipase/Acylhydrolase family